jgi:hypothetical protein
VLPVGEDGGVTPTPSSPDAALASALDLARAAVLEVAPAAHVGDHVEVAPEGDLLLTHYFTALAPGYRGWRWAVTVARTPEPGSEVTVAEVVLLPGAESLLAPAWLPWNERVRPGDLAPGDLYPTSPGDERLEPGYTGADALEAVDATESVLAPLRPEQWELGLGRETVLSPFGRDLATERWFDGDFGPDAPMAKAAPGNCRSCGFLLPIGGLVGQAFGVCANSFGADGRVVALGYGCGAHSSVREIEGTGVPVTDIVIDEYDNDPLDLRGDDEAEAAAAGAGLGDVVAVSNADDLDGVDVDDLIAESRDDDEALFPVTEVESLDDIDDEGDIELAGDLEDDDDNDDFDAPADTDVDAARVESELDDIDDIEPDNILG